jgi:hypothetical protein
MLAVIIPTVWLAVALFFVALCRMAARGDASTAPVIVRGLDELSTSSGTMPALAPVRLRRLHTATPCRSRTARRAQAPRRAPHSGRQRP